MSVCLSVRPVAPFLTFFSPGDTNSKYIWACGSSSIFSGKSTMVGFILNIERGVAI